MILGEVKARPKDIISFSLDYISKSKVQTSNPSSSPIPLDTPARPADFHERKDLLSTSSFFATSQSSFRADHLGAVDEDSSHEAGYDALMTSLVRDLGFWKDEMDGLEIES